MSEINRRNFITGAVGTLAARSACAGSSDQDKGLRHLIDGGPLIGVALPHYFDSKFPKKGQDLILKHFDSITPENCMKWPGLSPEEGKFRFDRPDRMVQYSQRHGLKFVGHTLVFNREQNYPKWLFLEGGKQADPKLVWKRIEVHLEKLMGRYQGKIDSWDVLNEFVEVGDPGYRHTDFTKVLGADYPIRLFKMAAAIDPKAKLTYNDFAVEEKGRRMKILAFIKKLQDAGCRVDVVGSQSHLELGQNTGDQVSETIEAFSKIGVKCAFTEVDVDVVSRKGHWNPKTREENRKFNPYPDSCPDEILQKQAEVYGALMNAVMEQQKWVDRVTFWGLDDGHSWLNNWPWKRQNHGLLFDRDFNEKPAFQAVKKALLKQ